MGHDNHVKTDQMVSECSSLNGRLSALGVLSKNQCADVQSARDCSTGVDAGLAFDPKRTLTYRSTTHLWLLQCASLRSFRAMPFTPFSIYIA